MDKSELRKAWRHAIEHDGGHCPVCDRWGKVYPRSINKSMAKSLIWLCSSDSDADNWVNVPVTGPQWVVRTNQLPTLRWWDLVERRANTEDEKKKREQSIKNSKDPVKKEQKILEEREKVDSQQILNQMLATNKDEIVGENPCSQELFSCSPIIKDHEGNPIHRCVINEDNCLVATKENKLFYESLQWDKLSKNIMEYMDIVLIS